MNRARRWKLGSAWAALALLASAGAPDLRAQSQDREFYFKAQFIRYFIQGTTWPGSALPDRSEVLRLGIVGRDPFDEKGKRKLTEKVVHRKRKLVVTVVKTPRDLSGLHVLYVPKGTPADLARKLLATVRNKPVLTIVDERSWGGVFSFSLTKKGKLVFHVDVKMARKCRLRIDSRLLRLARK